MKLSLRASMLALAVALGPFTTAADDIPAGFKSAVQKTGNVKLHYVRDGGSGEVVILLHGFPQTWSSWKKVMPLLSAGYDVIAVDLRGVGKSDKPKGGLRQEDVREGHQGVHGRTWH